SLAVRFGRRAGDEPRRDARKLKACKRSKSSSQRTTKKSSAPSVPRNESRIKSNMQKVKNRPVILKLLYHLSYLIFFFFDLFFF
ncbi:hypothetical protein CSUI_005260, partial [Cystoisospora suis]